MTTQISIFGLGYVGCVSAACFARMGHHVIGVDVNADKVRMINDGRSTIVEEGIAGLVAEVVSAGRLKATTSAAEAIAASDICFICVGTPSQPNGSINLNHVERVCAEIGQAARTKATPLTVVVRSTVLPGTTAGLAAKLQRAAGRRIDVCVNPEFLRLGSSIRDFENPPFVLIGADDSGPADRVAEIYHGLSAKIIKTSIGAAELVKYACNAFHGVKVAFANEIGNIASSIGVDGHQVMRILCADEKLNISPVYLRPGFAFGGSCLPKDLRAMTYAARQNDVATPLLSAALESNRRQIERAIELVLAAGNRRIGLLGLAFKSGTDDLRESPSVALAEALIGKGMQLSIYDPTVSPARLIGANRDFIEREIPHIWSLLKSSAQEVIDSADTIVIGQDSPEFQAISASPPALKKVIDLISGRR